MKIAILSCFYPYRGGISQFNASIFQELGKFNDVRAFNFKRQYPALLFPGKTQYVAENDTAVPVESTALLDTANPFSYIKTAAAIREWEPDLLIIRYWMPYFGPSLGYVSRHAGKGCKVVQILDNVIPHERRCLDRLLTKYFLSGGDGFVTMCREVAEDLKTFRPEAKNIILPHPIYTHFGDKLDKADAGRRLGIDTNCKILLFFGLIRQYKGLDILLEAFKSLPGDYRLIVAGEPYGSFEPYRKIIDESGCGDRIHLFLKYIEDYEVKLYFSVADLVVLPYRSATQSGISSIACHFEVPMVVTEVGGLKETVGDKGTGLLASDASPEAVRAEITKYFESEKIRTSCIESIKKEKERLSWHTFCEKLLGFAEGL